jgi:hypothetical protein
MFVHTGHTGGFRNACFVFRFLVLLDTGGLRSCVSEVFVSGMLVKCL